MRVDDAEYIDREVIFGPPMVACLLLASPVYRNGTDRK